MTVEIRTARLTILIDPRKKAVFERLCSEEDATPSQVVRRLIRGYIEGKLGRPWRPQDEPPPGDVHAAAAAVRRQRANRAESPAKQRGRAARRVKTTRQRPDTPSASER